MDDGWMDIAQISEHPALGLVPPMRPGEYAELKLDIEARGVQVPVEVLKGGVLLDGRHRVKASRELGLPVVPYRVVETGDPEGYVLKAAVLRRHLSDDQRAMLAAKWKVKTGNNIFDTPRRIAVPLAGSGSV